MTGCTATRVAIASIVVLCGMTDKCGRLVGLGVGRKLDVASTPEGATVKVDGVEKGKTPISITDLDVDKGQVQVVTIELAGYKTKEEKVAWTKAEQSLTVTLEEAERERVFTVKSLPSGAKVYVDGNNKGETPCSFSMAMLDRAEFNLLVQHKAYPDVTQKVNVGEETIITLSFNFKRAGGKAMADLDETLTEGEKRWRRACNTYPTDLCSFEYTISPGGEVTNVDNVTCKYKDITNCTRKQVEKMEFTGTGKLRSDAYTWRGSN